MPSGPFLPVIQEVGIPTFLSLLILNPFNECQCAATRFVRLRNSPGGTMTLELARVWLVKVSLTATGLIFLFFSVAPAIGYPLAWADALRVLEIVLPTFVGYLGLATQFVMSRPAPDEERMGRDGEMLGLLVRGPLIVFVIASVGAITAFGLSNGRHAQPGTGMSVDLLAAITSIGLGLLTVTTSVVVARVFAVKPDEKPAHP